VDGHGQPFAELRRWLEQTESQGRLIAAGVLTGIVAILSMATAWGPHNPCSLQFPKVIRCALGNYESLSGAPIAAGGALFAGWLAWSAIKEQIRLEKQKMLETKIDQPQRRAQDVSAALSATKFVTFKDAAGMTSRV
jgi:hypothetical protein